MEKNDNFILQLAKIADTIEKLNLNAGSNTLIFELSKLEYEKMYDYIQRQYGRQGYIIPEKSFSLKMGVVEIIFNTSNV